MLNTTELTISNPLLPTTYYNALISDQSRNIAVAFKERQASIDDLKLQQLYTKFKPLNYTNGKYYKLQEMSIDSIKNHTYIDDYENRKGNHLHLKKIAVMITLHHSNMPTYPRPSVQEVLTQLPDSLKSMESIFFHTDFPKRINDMRIAMKNPTFYGAEKEEEIIKLIQPITLKKYQLHLGTTTFFKVDVDSLQNATTDTIITQLHKNGQPIKSSIKKLLLPPILIADISKRVY